MNAQLDGEFRDFMHARWPAMVRLAYVLTGDQGHAEDVAQTAFARAYASWPNVRRTGNPEASVRRIVLRYWLGLTESEAAIELDCSVGTVKSQASRALASLRQSAELVDGGFQ